MATVDSDYLGRAIIEGVALTVLLRADQMDVSAGNCDAKWNAIRDNQVDENPLTELPAGLGLTIPTNGVDVIHAADEDGVWYMEFYDYGSTLIPEPMIARMLFYGVSAKGTPLMPGLYGRHSAVVPMKAGNTFRCRWQTNVNGTHAIYPALLVVRLA